MAKKKYEKKIFLITDGEAVSKFSKNKIEELAERINENDVKVNIICVGFNEELDKDDEDDSKENEGKMDKEDGEENTESDNQKKTKELLNILQSNTENVKLFTATTANDIYHQFKKKKINPVAKFRGPFIITPNLSFDVMTYSKTTPASIPSLKRYSKVAEYSDAPGSCEVQNERIYYVNDDPDKKAVEKELITKAYYYGASLVPISQTDEVRLKNEESKCLKVIGFTDSFRVPRHFFMGGVDIVVPNPTSPEDIIGVTAFVQEMIKINKVIIARYVYRNNSQPKLCVLTPHMSKKGPMFYLNILPTVEEIRDFQFDSLPEASKKQEEFMGHFIDSLDLEQDGEEEIKPTETYNPMLQYFYKCLEHKALEHDETKKNELPKIDEESIKNLIPNKNQKNLINKDNNDPNATHKNNTISANTNKYDEIYKRLQQKRDNNLTALKEKKEQEELLFCTFQPNMYKFTSGSKDKENKRNRLNKQQIDDNFEKLYQDGKASYIQKKKSIDPDFDDNLDNKINCTFKPVIHKFKDEVFNKNPIKEELQR